MQNVSFLARFDCLGDALHAARALACAGFGPARLEDQGRNAGDNGPGGHPALAAAAAALACGVTGLVIGLGAGGFTPIGWAYGLSIPVLTAAGGAVSGAAIATWSHLSARRHSSLHAAPALLLVDARQDDADAVRRLLSACNAAGVRVHSAHPETETVPEGSVRPEVA